MHHALLIDEILREIFEDCEKGALSAAARTCQAWKDPALDQLWRVLPSISPVLALLPQLKYEGKQYTLTQHPNSTDFARLTAYAHRVRRISIYSSPVLPPALHAVFDSLFPGISGLRLTGGAGDVDLTRFAGRTLRTLELDTSRSPALHGALARLPTLCPALAALRVRGPVSEESDTSLRLQSDLRALSLKLGASLRPAAVTALVRLPRLETLELHAERLNADALPLPAPGLLPALRWLRLRAHAATLVAFLALVPRDTLTDLLLDIEDTSLPASTAKHVCAAIAHAGQRSLHSVTLEWHHDGEGELNAHALRPLAALESLKHLVLDTRCVPDLADEEVRRLVKGWPGLEWLELGSAPVAEREERVKWGCKGTVGVLGVLARACPRLNVLMVPVDAGKEVEGLEEMEGGVRALERLTLLSPTVFNSAVMAERLQALFPLLKGVDGMPEHEELWVGVRDAMHLSCA
ncbi:hypothetical protein BD626DRAFT_411351 [Schizophyllum amplum]|uniref:F-box domain-containing protein n=1 Tax=Schizophyllum amplum TaxID=97359 RepID=A0A550BZI0_9AGAR|nr:hypothetical protein BD626DRAFT_411351 [Auriculariopsis ampla]